MEYTIGIDTGGTFTDVTVVASGRISFYKALTTPGRLDGVFNALRNAAEGLEFDLELFGRDANITYLTNKYRQRPEGVYGGHPGRMARLVIRDSATGRVKKVLPPKVSHPLRAGETLTCAVPGGGGYGDPRERDPQSVLLDYLDRYISLREARTVFGVVIDRGKRRVNLEATRRLRAGPGPG